MIQSCLFSVTDETKSMVTWKIYTNVFAAKADFFQMKERKHTYVPTVLRVGRGVFAINQPQQGRVNQLYNVGYCSHCTWSIPFIFQHKWPYHYSLAVIPYESATLKVLNQSFAAHTHAGKQMWPDWMHLQAIVAFARNKFQTALGHWWFLGPHSL